MSNRKAVDQELRAIVTNLTIQPSTVNCLISVVSSCLASWEGRNE